LRRKIRNICVSFIFILCFFEVNAQQSNVELAKIAFISQRLKLTSEQTPLFWPLYNEYNDKKAAIKLQIKKLSLENFNEKVTDSEILSDIKKLYILKQKELEIEKEFSEKCLKILTPKQFAELYQAERDFKIMLIKKLGEN
jgi:hypothetical protein